MLQKEDNEQILKQTVSNGGPVYEYVSEEEMLIFIQASVFSFKC